MSLGDFLEYWQAFLSQHRYRSIGCSGAAELFAMCIYHQTIAVLNHNIAHVTRYCRLGLAFLAKARFGICGRLVGSAVAFLAFNINPFVAAAIIVVIVVFHVEAFHFLQRHIDHFLDMANWLILGYCAYRRQGAEHSSLGEISSSYRIISGKETLYLIKCKCYGGVFTHQLTNKLVLY